MEDHRLCSSSNPRGERSRDSSRNIGHGSAERWRRRKGPIRRPEKSFLPDEKFLYLGEAYPLEIDDGIDGGRPLTLSFGKFILGKDRIEKARDLFVEWYKKEAKEKLSERVDYYSNRLQLFPKE